MNSKENKPKLTAAGALIVCLFILGAGIAACNVIIETTVTNALIALLFFLSGTFDLSPKYYKHDSKTD